MMLQSFSAFSKRTGIYLLRRCDPLFSVNMFPLSQYKGYKFASHLTTANHIESLQSMEIREDDVFLVTFPKSGTIWTQQIIISIYELSGGLPEYPNNLRHMAWVEFNRIKEDFSKRPSPRLFTSHLPPSLMPPEMKDKKSKVIYVMRNPKDVAKSYHNFVYATTSFEEFLEQFLAGDVGASSWFDHISAWRSVRDQYDILFLSYEDMNLDLRGAVVKICSFLGRKLSDTDVDKVVQKAKFETIKEDSKANYSFQPQLQRTGDFMRKGRIGDWRNTFTVAQSDRVDRMLKEKLGDNNLKLIWE